MTANEVIKNVWVGDLEDAKIWEGNKICVLERYPDGYTKTKNSLLIPILSHEHHHLEDENAEVMMENIDLVSSVIQNHIMSGEKVLVHCMGGMERSPLAVTWYLHKNAGVSLTDAFDFVKKKRPQALNRIQWLNTTYADL